MPRCEGAKMSRLVAGLVLIFGAAEGVNAQNRIIEQLSAQAQAALNNGQLDEALKALEQLVQMAPDSPDPYYRLGRIYIARNEPDRAIEVLSKALALRSDFAEAHHSLGAAHLQRREYDKAEKV